jgi:hypothetical protein
MLINLNNILKMNSLISNLNNMSFQNIIDANFLGKKLKSMKKATKFFTLEGNVSFDFRLILSKP